MQNVFLSVTKGTSEPAKFLEMLAPFALLPLIPSNGDYQPLQRIRRPWYPAPRLCREGRHFRLGWHQFETWSGVF